MDGFIVTLYYGGLLHCEKRRKEADGEVTLGTAHASGQATNPGQATANTRRQKTEPYFTLPLPFHEPILSRGSQEKHLRKSPYLASTKCFWYTPK